MHDWNGNGRFDGGDAYINYMIYKQATKRSSQKPTGSGCLTSVVGTAFIIGIVFVMLIVWVS